MIRSDKNSLDLLRLTAAIMVLYSHQYALLKLPEPSFFGWTLLGGAGITIFFFLSGILVWWSWERDPDLPRFFVRRSLRIFPALWAVVLGSIFFLGPAFTTLCWSDYFSESGTWRYLTTALLVPQNGLPGVFSNNPHPLSVNASLWTLPVEFLCYLSVALLGVVKFASKGVLITASLLFAVLIVSFPPPIAGGRYVPNFEMIAVFWSGVFYVHCIRRPLAATPLRTVSLVLAVIALAAWFKKAGMWVTRSL